MMTDGFPQTYAPRRLPMQNGISLVLPNLRIRRFARFDMRLKIKNEKVATLTVSNAKVYEKVATLTVSNAKVSRNSSEIFSGYSC